MKKNVGKIDVAVRLILAAFLIVLFVAKVATGALGIAGLAVAGVLVLTSIIQYCPIWAALKVNTRKTGGA